MKHLSFVSIRLISCILVHSDPYRPLIYPDLPFKARFHPELFRWHKSLKPLKFQRKSEAEICVLSDFLSPGRYIIPCDLSLFLPIWTISCFTAIEDPKHDAGMRFSCQYFGSINKTHF